MPINKDELDAYIKKRRELYGYSLPSKSQQNKQSQGSILEKLNFFKGFGSKDENVVKLKPEIKEADEMIQEIETNKQVQKEEKVYEKERSEPIKVGFIEKIKGVFIKKQDKVYVEETVEKETVELDYEEIRQAFRIANSLIKKLPPAVLKAFKESDSYHVYVNTMRKLKLVKEKTSENESTQ